MGKGVGSKIDLTLSSENMARKLNGWQVLDMETLSDHAYIAFTLNQEAKKMVEPRRNRSEIEMETLAFNMKKMFEEPRLNPTAGNISRILGKSYTQSTSWTTTTNKGVPYWWTNEISEIRQRCLKSRRCVQRVQRRRIRNQARVKEVQEEYKSYKRELRLKIRASKRTRWESLCREIDSNVWGDSYKIAMKSLGLAQETPCKLPDAVKIWAVETLFPNHPEWHWTKRPTNQVHLFSLQDIKGAGEKIKIGRAPGPDMIPPEVVKQATKVIPEFLLKVYNRLLEKGEFPSRWKIARLVLIWKGKKAWLDPEAYRPICLLDALGKLYEQLIRMRIEEELELTGGLSVRQFGFRRKRSTLHAVEQNIKIVEGANQGSRKRKKMSALITLDVKNAFNTAPWRNIMKALRNRNIPDYLLNVIGSYLEERFIIVEKNQTVQVSAGVPQGQPCGTSYMMGS